MLQAQNSPASPAVSSAFGLDEVKLIARTAHVVLPTLPDLARRWTDRLEIDVPPDQAAEVRKTIEQINLTILNGLFGRLADEDIVGALQFYEDYHKQLISSQLQLPDTQQIKLEQFFVSAQIAMPLLDQMVAGTLTLDELTAAKTQLCFHKFWNQTLQSLGRVYSRLREAHLESLHKTIADSEQRLRVLYDDAKRAEQARRESERRFAQFMQNLPGAAFIKDGRGRYLYVNETVEQVSHIKRERWIGKTDAEIWPIDGANQALESDRQVLKRREPLQVVDTIGDGDDTRHWLVTKFPILAEDGEVAMIGGVSLDITAQKRAEEELKRARDAALESARLKSAFLANMSHEIRTPLNIILGYNSLIAEHFAKSGDSSQAAVLETIGRAGRRLIDTIHRILDLSKIETGGFELRRRRVDLQPLIEAQIEDFRMLAEQKGLSISCCTEVEGAAVEFDEYCLLQALTNLLQNAMKFTQKGQIAVRLYRDDHGLFSVEVRDTGIGIDAAYLPRLFEPFTQEQSGYTRPYEGSGLGLTLVRRYLALNGASLDVRSCKGEGSVFTIRFSSAEAASAEANPTPSAQSSA